TVCSSGRSPNARSVCGSSSDRCASDLFAAGTTYTDTFSVASADGTLTSVTINIAGTNDAAVLSADTRNLTETNAAADISTSGTQIGSASGRQRSVVASPATGCR